MSERPTHIHRKSGHLVFPQGYRKRALKPLPDGYWLEQDRQELVRAIKSAAARRIEAISPAWRQLNDMREPSESGAARFAAIDAVRAWSDDLERQALAATTEQGLTAVLALVEKGPAA